VKGHEIDEMKDREGISEEKLEDTKGLNEEKDLKAYQLDHHEINEEFD